MLQDVLRRMDLAAAPSWSLLLFLSMFVGIAVWAIASRNHHHFRTMATLPLDAGEIDQAAARSGDKE